MQRRDWTLGRLHVIKRKYAEPPQWGWLWWKPTLDVWVGNTLLTFRWIRA